MVNGSTSARLAPGPPRQGLNKSLLATSTPHKPRQRASQGRPSRLSDTERTRLVEVAIQEDLMDGPDDDSSGDYE